MMCADSIVSYLSQNFITWAWDVTQEANKARYSTFTALIHGAFTLQPVMIVSKVFATLGLAGQHYCTVGIREM